MDDGALGGRGREATEDASVQVPNNHAGGVADGIPRALQEGRAMRVWWYDGEEYVRLSNDRSGSWILHMWLEIVQFCFPSDSLCPLPSKVHVYCDAKAKYSFLLVLIPLKTPLFPIP